ncbi:MAG: hypothetical protein Q7S79_00875 [bacterium]|nr:hypothetical protein [bacterium]
MQQRGFAPVLVLFGVLALGLIIGGAMFLSKYEIGFRNTPAEELSKNEAKNIDLSLLFSINKASLQDHNYDTYTPLANQTYKSNIVLEEKTPVNVGYTNERESKYKYETSESGKYLLRFTSNSIEIASAPNPESFTNIFSLQEGKITNFLFSKDESKIVILYYEPSPKISIQSTTNPEDRILVTPRRAEDSYSIFGYDTKRKQLYWNRSEGPMSHYAERVFLDDSGNITQIKSINDFSFITEFNSSYEYAYYESSGSKAEGYTNQIIQQNLKTGKKDKLAEFPNEAGVVDMKLSPTGDKLFFIDNRGTKATNTFYMINLQTKKMESFPINAGFNPAKKNYISPDGKYLIFQINISCRNNDCNTKHEGERILFDVGKRQFYKLYTSIGVIESALDDSNNYHEIETFDFLGWLSVPGVTSAQIETLPLSDMLE